MIVCMSTMFLLIGISSVTSQPNSISLLKTYEGIYKDDSGKKYYLNPSEGFPHFTVMDGGETHMINLNDQSVFEFSSTRNSWKEIGGTITFKSDNGKKQMCIKYWERDPVCLYSMPVSSKNMSLMLGDSLEISGVFKEPVDAKSELVAVTLHGDGEFK